jgi:hypothetical protein
MMEPECEILIVVGDTVEAVSMGPHTMKQVVMESIFGGNRAQDVKLSM